jgi:e3 binding domain
MLVEPDISPLAKRLAEENNVNWRGLLGSGAGGKIVERDVLEYLAKVMAGEEDINPTAEPLPEGMEAWPEDDVRSFYGGAVPAEQEAPVAEAEEDLFVDSPDLGGFDTDSFDAPAAVSSMTHQASDDTASLGEDIFLIDDEVPVQSASAHMLDMTDEPAFVSEIEPFTEDTLGNDDIALVDDIAMVNDGNIVDEISSFDDADNEVFAAMSEGVDDTFTTDTTDGDVEDLASLFVEETDGVEDTYAEASVVDQTVSFEAPAEPAYDSPAYTSESVAHEDVVEAFAAEPVEDVIASFEEPVFEPVQNLEDSFVEEPVVQVPVAEVIQPEPTYNEPTFNKPTFHDVAPVVAAVAGAGMAASALSQVPVSEAPVSEAPVLTPSVAPVVPSNIPLVSYGVLLRRHIDLSTLMHAQQAITEEMGHEETGSVASLLLRAAAKAQQKVSLVSGKSIGLAVIRDQGVSVVHVKDAHNAPFRTVMSQTQQALSSHKADTVDLAVADMSGFDIDEAVLNIGVPVLTLGRTMYDSSKGTHHSTLSLSGNVSIETGTKFLSAVAELLATPVRLVI